MAMNFFKHSLIATNMRFISIVSFFFGIYGHSFHKNTKNKLLLLLFLSCFVDAIEWSNDLLYSFVNDIIVYILYK